MKVGEIYVTTWMHYGGMPCFFRVARVTAKIAHLETMDHAALTDLKSPDRWYRPTKPRAWEGPPIRSRLNGRLMGSHWSGVLNLSKWDGKPFRGYDD